MGRRCRDAPLHTGTLPRAREGKDGADAGSVGRSLKVEAETADGTQAETIGAGCVSQQGPEQLVKRLDKRAARMANPSGQAGLSAQRYTRDTSGAGPGRRHSREPGERD